MQSLASGSRCTSLSVQRVDVCGSFSPNSSSATCNRLSELSKISDKSPCGIQRLTSKINPGTLPEPWLGANFWPFSCGSSLASSLCPFGHTEPKYPKPYSKSRCNLLGCHLHPQNTFQPSTFCSKLWSVNSHSPFFAQSWIIIPHFDGWFQGPDGFTLPLFWAHIWSGGFGSDRGRQHPEASKDGRFANLGKANGFVSKSAYTPKKFESFSLWFSFGVPLVFLWASFGFPLVFLWFSFGLPLAFLWLSLVFLWLSLGFPLVLLWSSFGFPLAFFGFPFAFLGFSFGFPYHLNTGTFKKELMAKLVSCDRQVSGNNMGDLKPQMSVLLGCPIATWGFLTP